MTESSSFFPHMPISSLSVEEAEFESALESLEWVRGSV